MSERNQIVVVLIVALLLGAVVDSDHGLKDSRWSGSAVDAAEPISDFGMHPEAVLVTARKAFGSRVPGRQFDGSCRLAS